MMKLLLPAEVRSRLKVDLRKGGRREIGGLLMAEQLASDGFRVVDFTVDHDEGGVAHFQRRPEHHRMRLQAFFDSTGNDYRRFNYLGEWHSHPSYDIRPSHTDVTAMRALVQEPNIEFAVLLIVRLRVSCWLSMRAEMYTCDGARFQLQIA